MTEKTIGGHNYRFGKIDARTQFHIVRRLAPTIAGLMTMADLVGEGEASPSPGDLLTKIEPFLQAIGAMSDTDANYILDHCLAVAQRGVEGDRGWSPVMAQGGRLMFEDIDIGVMMQLAFEAARENLEGFFGVMASALPGLKAPAA